MPAPTVNITFDETALKIGETANVTFRFSAAPVGFIASDVTVTNGTFSYFSATVDPLVYTGVFTPGAGVNGASGAVSVAAGSYTDTLGEPGLAGLSPMIAIDTLAPSVAITSSRATVHAGETATITFTFSEAPVGFGLEDVAVGGGTLSPLQTTGNPLVYTADFTPTAGVASGSATISVSNGSYTDEAGNSGASGATPSMTIQTMRPTATIDFSDAALKINDTAGVTFTFSEAVTGFTNADLTITHGTLSAVSSADGGITWTATFTPSANVTDATNLITLDMTGVTSLSGNAGAGTIDSSNYAVDTTRPTAAITLADPALGIAQTSLVTFTFSEAVSGFTNVDLTIDNGTLSAVSSSDGGITWTGTFTPAAGVTQAGNVIRLDMTGVTDAAGNAGAGVANSLTYVVDHQRPTATIVLSDSELKAGETSRVTFTFSEAVTGFTTADLTVPNGTVAGLSSSDGGVTWIGNFTPDLGVNAASNVITLDNTGYTDLAGNSGTGVTNSGNFTIQTVIPTATIVVAQSDFGIGDFAQVTITFSESVSGLTIDDLNIANGTVGALVTTDGGITWKTTLTANANVSDSSNVITLDMSRVTNAAGNAGVGTAGSNNYAVDTARPTATISVANAQLQAGQTSLVSINFSEAVSGFDLSDLSVANGALSGLTSSDGGVSWTATFTPTASVSDPTNLILLDTAQVVDLAGNAGSSIAISNNYVVGYVPPTPVTDDDVISLPADGGSVSAGAGADSVSGAAGADIIQGNIGDDTLTGGGGDDIVRGGQDNDFVHGNVGADQLFGDLGDDSVFGGQGDDFAQGGAGSDYVLGDLGRDTVLGGQGADTVLGGAGDDYLSGDLGDDVLMGGAGADLFNFNGGGGRDVVMDFSHAEGDRIRIAPTDAADYAALVARFVADPAGTLIQLGGQTILLAGVAPGSLSAADFVFG